MFKRFALLCGLLMSVVNVQAATVDQTDPYQMMKQVAQNTFDRLAKDQGVIQSNPNHLKTVVDQELMPFVNEQYAALKLLGSNLKGAKREDVMAFIKAFRGYLVTNYAQVLTQYNGQKIEFGREPVLDGDERIVGIQVSIVDAPNPNINLEFKLRKDKSGEWQAFDMVAEGISLLSAKQSEWSDKIRKEGIASVAKELDQLAAQPIKIEKKS